MKDRTDLKVGDNILYRKKYTFYIKDELIEFSCIDAGKITKMQMQEYRNTKFYVNYERETYIELDNIVSKVD